MCAEHASAEHLANVLGALGLAVADDVLDAAVGVAGAPASVPAAVGVVGTWGAGSSIDLLARTLGVTHSRAVRVVDRLQDEGLVRRERSREDAREVLLQPTARGRRLAGRMHDGRAAIVEEWLAPLDATERAQLGTLVDKMLEARAAEHLVAVHACRLCDVERCGHPAGCPVTRGAAR